MYMQEMAIYELAKHVLDQSPEAIIWFTETGEIVYSNNLALQIFESKALVHSHISGLPLVLNSTNWESVIATLKDENPIKITAEFKENLFEVELQNISASSGKFVHCAFRIAKRVVKNEPQNLYESLFYNSSHFFAMIYMDGSVKELNYCAAKILGLTSSENIIDQPVWETILFNRAAEKQAKIKQYFQQAASGKTVTFSFEFLNFKRKRIALRFSLRPIKSDIGEILYILAEGFDISNLKKAEAALRKNETMYRKLTQSIPNTLFQQFDCDLRFTLVEGQVLEKIGRTKEDIIGKTLYEVAPPESLPRLLPYYKAAVTGGTTSYETEFQGAYFLLSFMPMYNDANEINGGLLIAFDISKPKATEELLNRKLSELEEVNARLTKEVTIRRNIEQNLKNYSEELKAKNQELEQFAYVASHDLQEPLRMISSFTQLLARKYQDKLDGDANEFIKYTLEGAARMQQLINDLLIYSRVGRKGSEFQKTDITEIVESTKQILQLTLDETDAEITYENLPIISSDQGQLTQLFQNLISNAIKFRQKNIVPQIRISAEDKATFWQIAVSDNGIGFNMTHSERIFNIFQRLHSKDEFSGTGIGLAICKKIVERHGGEIWAESEEGKGSTFYFTIRKS